VAERYHYLAALKKAGIDPGPAPTPPPPAGPPPTASVSLPGSSESSVLPSGPGATAPEGSAESDGDEEGDGEPVA
jgi:hypothetical protein